MYCNFSSAYLFAILLSLLHVVSHLSIFHFLPQFGIFKCKHTHIFAVHTTKYFTSFHRVWQAGICPTLFHSFSCSYCGVFTLSLSLTLSLTHTLSLSSHSFSLFHSDVIRLYTEEWISYKSFYIANNFQRIRGILCGSKLETTIQTKKMLVDM